MLTADDETRRAGVLGFKKRGCRLQSDIRVVVDFGKMGEKNTLQSRMEDFLKKLCRFRVGKMTVTRLDALLEVPGVRTIQKHLFIMIGFDN